YRAAHDADDLEAFQPVIGAGMRGSHIAEPNHQDFHFIGQYRLLRSAPRLIAIHFGLDTLDARASQRPRELTLAAISMMPACVAMRTHRPSMGARAVPGQLPLPAPQRRFTCLGC